MVTVLPNGEEKKKKRQLKENVHMGIFVNQEKIHPIHFSSHFGGFREKTFEPYHLFSFLSIQPNILQKSFSSNFFSKVFHPFVSPQTNTP